MNNPKDDELYTEGRGRVLVGFTALAEGDVAQSLNWMNECGFRVC